MSRRLFPHSQWLLISSSFLGDLSFLLSRTNVGAAGQQFATIDVRTFGLDVELAVGKIYRFPFPKYLSKLDPSDRSGTYVLGIGMIAGSALLSTYGIGLAIGIAWSIGILFIVGLFWEDFPKPVSLFTLFIGWFGILITALTVCYATFLILNNQTTIEDSKAMVTLTTLGSSVFGFLFFADVIRGARVQRRSALIGDNELR